MKTNNSVCLQWKYYISMCPDNPTHSMQVIEILKFVNLIWIISFSVAKILRNCQNDYIYINLLA